MIYAAEFRRRRILTSALPEMLPVPHLEYGFHPCSQPVHHKTWRGTLSCPQPKHTVGRKAKKAKREMKTCCSSSVISLTRRGRIFEMGVVLTAVILHVALILDIKNKSLCEY